MNTVQLVGRFTRTPEIRYTDGGLSIARFSLAVDRRFKQDGEQTADFISCIAFGKTAEFIEKYFTQGMRAGVTGRIQTGSYTNKEGTKVYTTDVIVENIEFVESKRAESSGTAQQPDANNGFMSIPDGVEDEGLPFN